MKKFILSLVIMGLGIMALIGAALTVSGEPALGFYDLYVTLIWILCTLGFVGVFYGAITAFIEAKKK